MDQPTVLLVEDDLRLSQLVEEWLGHHGYQVRCETQGDIALARIQTEAPDLVILDLNLPGMDGLEICRRVRASYSGRILMLTARGDEIDEVVGLEVGADAYLAKPVSPRKLLAHARALLRRAATTAEVRTGPLLIAPGRRVVEKHGQPIELTTAEFDLLWLLARNIGRPVGRETLHQELRGLDYDGLNRAVDLRISRIRRAIEDNPRRPILIKTIRGAGYMLARIP